MPESTQHTSPPKKIKVNYYALAVFFSIIWVSCIAGFLAVIAYTSNFMTSDPDFPAGSPQLIAMLGFFSVGSLAFLLTCVFYLVTFFRRNNENGIVLLGLKIRHSVFVVAILLFGAVSFLFGFRQANLANIQLDTTYSGQDVLDAINAHRVSKGLKSLDLEPQICDNLVQRWLDMKNGKDIGHQGFEAWATQEQLLSYYDQVAEMYMLNAEDTDIAISFWEGSPGHRQTLEGNFDVACAYANDGVIVTVLGTRMAQ